MAIDFSKYQVGGAKPQPVQTPQQPKATGSINFDKYRVSAPTQPQAPVVQQPTPTQTFTQKLQQAGSFISGATEKIKDFISPNRTKTPPVKLPTSGNFVTLTTPKVTLEPMTTQQAPSAQVTTQARQKYLKPDDFWSVEATEQRKKKINDEIIASAREVRPGYKEPGVWGGVVEEIKQAGVSLAGLAGANLEMVGNMTQLIGLTKAGEKIQKESDKMLASNPEWKMEDKWNATKIARLVAGAVPSLLAVVGASIVGGPAASVATGLALAGGSTYKESKQAGVPEWKAQQNAITVGSISGVLDALFPGKKQAERAAKPVIEEVSKSLRREFINKAKKFGVTMTVDGILEGTTEALQELTANVVATSYDKDRKLWDNLLESFVGGFGSGAVTGAVLPDGEYTPDDVINKVVTTDLKNTEDGKALIKAALEAKNQGLNIQISGKEEPVAVSKEKEEKPVEKPLSPTDRGEVVPVVPVTKQQPDLSKVTSEKDKQDYETILKPKIDALPETKPNEVVVIQTGTSEYVDTQIDEALSRGVNENTKVMVVNKNDLSLTDNNEKNLRGERLLKTPTTEIKQTTKQDPLEALKTEARKYKSAEEFIKAQGETLYHGTPAKFDTKDFKGGYLTADKSYADVYKNPSASSISYGSAGIKNKLSGEPRTLEFVLPKNAKIFDYTNPQHRKLLDDYWGKSSMSYDPVTGKSGQIDWTEGENLVEYFDEKGIKFDGIKLDEAGGIDPSSGLEVKRSPSIRIINPKILRDKSQLTDLYNQATAEKKQSKPEVKKPAKKKTPDRDNKFTSRVFERLQEENKDLTGELLVDRVRLQEDAEKAVDLIAKDKQKAYRIAMGEEKSDAITSTATNIALAEEALREGNTKLYADLVKNRSIAQTRRGQEISAERGSVTDNSTSRYVKELLSIRLENVGRSYLKDLQPGKATNKEKANNVIDRKVAAFEKKVKANKIDVKTALKLLDEITCI